MMDYASLVVFNPCEALICDLVDDSDNHNESTSSNDSAKRFSIYSATLSLGSCLGTPSDASLVINHHVSHYIFH